MSSNTTVAREFFEILSADGVRAALDRCASPNVVWWSAGAGDVQDKIADFMEAFGAQVVGAFQLDLKSTTAEGDRVAVEATLYAELSGDRIYDNKYLFLFEFAQGAITRINEYHDTRHVYETVGATLRDVGLIHD